MEASNLLFDYRTKRLMEATKLHNKIVVPINKIVTQKNLFAFDKLLTFKAISGGMIYASAHALTPPHISNTAPKSSTAILMINESTVTKIVDA